MSIQSILNEKVTSAIHQAGIQEEFNPAVRASTKPQFGDYQVNGLMGIAKRHKINPRELATNVLTHLDLDNIAEKVEIAGPGFLNIFLKNEWLSSHISSLVQENNIKMTDQKKQTIVVDYSAPNIAKEMHVGHLRTTIIGDCLVKVLDYLGHNVIRANHIGDWGTPFGMLIAHLEDIEGNAKNHQELSDLDMFYKAAQKKFKENEEFANKARKYVSELHNGNEKIISQWKKLIDITMSQNQTLYNRLNISLSQENIMGESFYNPMLPGIVNDLLSKNIATKDHGATVVFLEEFKNRDGNPMGVIIQKKDGAYLYTTTDIACLKYRYETLKADRILYCIDARQNQHLQQIWAISKKANYVSENISLEHIQNGMVLGDDGKPFKTRSGKTVKLLSLIDESESRAYKLIKDKNPTLSDAEITKMAKLIGGASIKYAELSKSRTTDYIFNFDNMLSFTGNTAPYLLYAYTRIQSILSKSNLHPLQQNYKLIITNDIEKQIALQVAQFEDIVKTVAKDGTPHILCSYLYNLSGLFSSFYESNPILQENEEIKHSRLLLVQIVSIVIKTSLDLLGIEALNKM